MPHVVSAYPGHGLIVWPHHPDSGLFAAPQQTTLWAKSGRGGPPAQTAAHPLTAAVQADAGDGSRGPIRDVAFASVVAFFSLGGEGGSSDGI